MLVARGEWADAHAGLLEELFRVTAESFARVSAWGSREWASYAAGIPGRDGEEEQAVWEATRPLIAGSGTLFSHDLHALEGLQDILRARGIMESDTDLRSLFTDRFLVRVPASAEG